MFLTIQTDLCFEYHNSYLSLTFFSQNCCSLFNVLLLFFILVPTAQLQLSRGMHFETPSVVSTFEAKKTLILIKTFFTIYNYYKIMLSLLIHTCKYHTHKEWLKFIVPVAINMFTYNIGCKQITDKFVQFCK